MTKKIEEASRAVAEAVKLCRPQVIPIYPITPQTHNAEALAEFVANGELDASVIDMESEHSVMAAAIGAAATGTRTYTATSSQGLKYMSEMLFVASGMRLPIVMMVANRALSAPINIWNDHSDTMAERDCGWFQFFAESTQEAVDRMIMAFKISEECNLPSMVCLDGFVLTHVYENVDMPSQQEVDKFLPKRKPLFILDPAKPITMGAVGGPDSYFEMKVMQHEDMRNAIKTIDRTQGEFAKQFKRKYQMIETYKTEDAERIIIDMGTIAGTTRVVVDELRAQKKKVGMIKLSVFRPFPREELAKIIGGCKKLKQLIIIDRAISTGNAGPLYSEIRDALFGLSRCEIFGYVAGLGGRDVTKEHIIKAFNGEKNKWLT